MSVARESKERLAAPAHAVGAFHFIREPTRKKSVPGCKDCGFQHIGTTYALDAERLVEWHLDPHRCPSYDDLVKMDDAEQLVI